MKAVDYRLYFILYIVYLTSSGYDTDISNTAKPPPTARRTLAQALTLPTPPTAPPHPMAPLPPTPPLTPAPPPPGVTSPAEMQKKMGLGMLSS